MRASTRPSASAKTAVLVRRAHRHPDPTGRAEAAESAARSRPPASRRSKSGRESSPTSAKTKFATAGPAGSKPCSRSAALDRSARPSALMRRRRSSSPRAGRGEARERGLLGRRGDVEGAADLADGGHDLGRRRRRSRRAARRGRRSSRTSAGRRRAARASGTSSIAVRVVRVVDVLEVRLVEDGEHVVRALARSTSSSSARVFVVPVGLFGWQT